MAETTITDAAEKAYAQASEKAVAAKPAVTAPAASAPPAAAAPAPVASAPAPVKVEPAAQVPAPVAYKTAAKIAVKRVAKPAIAAKAKPAPKAKAAAKPVVAAKAKPVRKAPVKLAKPVSKPVPTTILPKLKDTAMATTAKKTAEDFSTKIQDAMKDAQERAKTAFEKSQAAMGDVNEFSKGNLEALVETGKVLASGMQTLSKSYVAEVTSTSEAIQADAKELTSVKSPKEFVEIQSKLLRKYFDSAVAFNSKNAEATLKLANEAFQPISSRVSLAVEKVRKAA
jgi:phasin family protein